MPFICLVLLIIFAPGLFAQDNLHTFVPDIHEFVYVDFQPAPTNLTVVLRHIGYPPKAYKEGIEGYVHCRILVDLQGHYMAHKIMKTAHPLLADAVESELDKLRFSPAMRDNVPICYWVNLPICFRKKDYPPCEFKRHTRSIKRSRPLFPRNKKIQTFMEEGRHYFADQEFIKARRAIRSCIFLSPKGKHVSSSEQLFLSDAWAFLGIIEMQNHHWDKAVEAYSEAIAIRRELNRENDTTLTYLHLKRGQALLESQQVLRAIDDVNWVLKRVSHDPIATQAYRTRGQIYHLMGDQEAALSDIEFARQQSPSRIHYYLKAWILYQMKAYPSALRTLEEGEAGGIIPNQNWISLKSRARNPVASN